MKNNRARTLLPALLASCVSLAAAPTPAAATDLFSATRPVIAIVDGELFVGKAIGHLDGAGTIAVHSQLNPSLTCLGEFTSSAKLGGKGDLRCSDGSSSSFQFNRIDAYRGYGAGQSSRGLLTFAYGLTTEEAAPYLTLPGGKKFSLAGTELTLVDQ